MPIWKEQGVELFSFGLATQLQVDVGTSEKLVLDSMDSLLSLVQCIFNQEAYQNYCELSYITAKLA